MIRSMILAIALSGAAIPIAADAATTFHRVEFAGTFEDSPLTSISGFFTVSKDSVTGAGSLVDVGVTIGATRFTMANSGGAVVPRTSSRPASLSAGGVIGSGDVYRFVLPETDDWVVTIDKDDLDNSTFLYTMAGWGGFGAAFVLDGTMSVTVREIADPAAAVPEPATWTLMIGGVGMVGAAARRRRARPRAALAA